ncbi:MAG: formate dehydrogenase accessory sulfurtransferase FdhD [Desulfosudaceae bacterium]
MSVENTNKEAGGTSGRSLMRRVTRFGDGAGQVDEMPIIVEEPLSIRIDGRPYSVVMRTPGDETAHVAGFCLAEGLVDSPDDIVTIGFCTEEGTNVATVTLTAERRSVAGGLLDRRGFVSQTSCGICGKEVLQDMQQIMRPLAAQTRLTPDQIRVAVGMLLPRQKLHKQTRGAHAAMILDNDNRVLSMAEDVGRHNALDKAIGDLFWQEKLDSAVLGVMSSRLSYELVQKAARGGLEVLVGISRPTLLAVELAASLNMTLACAQDGQVLVFTGAERVGEQPPESEPSV